MGWASRANLPSSISKIRGGETRPFFLKMYNKPNAIDLVWFAGFFDGEGCVTLHKKLRII